MAPCTITEDYYDVLGIHQTAATEDVIKSYRRLALLRHPDRNSDKSRATACFQLLGEAYETLKDPHLRHKYDAIWPSLRRTQGTSTYAGTPESRASKKDKKPPEDEERAQKDATARLARLQELRSRKARHDTDAFECKSRIAKLEADLKRYRQQDEEDVQKDREGNSWWTYIASSILNAPAETAEQRQEREAARLQRLAATRVKEDQLSKAQAVLRKQENAMKEIDAEVAAEVYQTQHDAWIRAAQAEACRRREEQLKREQEVREQEAERLRRANIERERREQRARQAREAQESARRSAAAQRDRSAGAKKQDTKPTQSARRACNEDYEPSKPSAACRHGFFWAKIEGRHVCSQCVKTQNLFAFKCPGCGKIACASCRKMLRGEKQGGTRRQYHHRRDPGPESESNYNHFYDYD